MKKTILSGARVIADVSRGIYYLGGYSPEKEAKAMESLVSEFNDFVRDHRSMDWINLEIEREYQVVCSHCGHEWEEDELGPVCCDAALKEHLKQKNGEAA